MLSTRMVLKWFLTPVFLVLLIFASWVGLVCLMKFLPLFLWQLSGQLVLEITQLCPHSDRLDVGRRGSHVSAPLGVDEHKASILLGWQVPPACLSLRNKECREKRCRRCQRKISCFITHNLVMCLLCVKGLCRWVARWDFWSFDSTLERVVYAQLWTALLSELKLLQSHFQ